MMNNEILTTNQIVSLTGVSSQKLHYWTLKQVFIPYDPSSGTGTTRRFTFQNLLEISIAKTLILEGLSIDRVSAILDSIRNKASDFFDKTLQRPKLSENDKILCIRFGVNDPKIAVTNIYTLKITKEKLDSLFASRPRLTLINLDKLKADLVHKLELLD
jgi:DNA-binding transcriptional MerR regulator